MTLPPSRTRILSQCLIVESLCAITIRVQPKVYIIKDGAYAEP